MRNRWEAHSRLTMPVFQLTASSHLGSDLYGLLYGGMLESMYGGGGEMLYRALGDRRRCELGKTARLRPGSFIPQVPHSLYDLTSDRDLFDGNLQKIVE